MQPGGAISAVGALWRTACLCLCAVALAALAQPAPRISELSPLDHDYLAQQRQLVTDLAARHLGRGLGGDRDRDIDTLQSLLDERVVTPEQTRELQAMGVILGDLLAADLDMHWVVYEDAQGRSRALRYRDSDNYLFPITMISRRREAGSDTAVATIYRRAHDIIAGVRAPVPFQ